MKYRALWLLGTIIVFVGFGIASGEPQTSMTQPSVSSEEFETCAGCHESEAEAFLRGPHSVLGEQGWAASHGADFGCSGCHGDPTAHLDSGGEPGNILAFSSEEFANAKSMQCLTCHADAHPAYLSSRHARAGLDCTSCHGAHAADGTKRFLLKPSDDADFASTIGASASCAGCHADVFVQFDSAERHRLQEGALDCSTCHDPHASSARWRLGGFKQEACVSCHADKSGPFVFEHGSQRVEGCVACHQPHGSPNRHMLTFQSVADLCYSCHAAVPGFHTRFNAESGCTNCHSTIHGSNFDSAFLK